MTEINNIRIEVPTSEFVGDGWAAVPNPTGRCATGEVWVILREDASSRSAVVFVAGGPTRHEYWHHRDQPGGGATIVTRSGGCEYVRRDVPAARAALGPLAQFFPAEWPEDGDAG